MHDSCHTTGKHGIASIGAALRPIGEISGDCVSSPQGNAKLALHAQAPDIAAVVPVALARQQEAPSHCAVLLLVDASLATAVTMPTARAAPIPE